jgi:hypothetical protein
VALEKGPAEQPLGSLGSLGEASGLLRLQGGWGLEDEAFYLPWYEAQG